MIENENINTKITDVSEPFRRLLMAALGYGVVLSTMHGAFIGDRHTDVAPVEFSTKVTSELHTHNDIRLQSNRVVIDPKSLRSVRSEGDKQAESDSLRGGWGVYNG